jgi:outer membrane protein
MIHITVSIFTLLVVGNLNQHTYGQDAQPLSLQTAVDTALELNRELGAVRYDAMAVQHSIWEAKSAYLPQVSYKSEFSNSESDLYSFDMPTLPPPFDTLFSFDSFGGFTGEIYTNQFQFSQLIYDRSVIGNIKLSNLKQEASRWQETGQTQQVVFNTVAAYLDVLRAVELLSVQEQRLTLAEKQLDTAQTNFDVGLRIRTDVLRAELTKSSAMRDIVSAEIARDKAVVHLNEIMGVPVQSNQTLHFEGLAGYNPPEAQMEFLKSYEQLFAVATDNNPAVHVAAIVLNQNTESLAMAKGEFYPRVRMGGSWGFRENSMNFEDEEWALSISVEVPIVEGGRKLAKIRRTTEEQNAQGKRYEDTVRVIEKAVEQSSLALQEEFRNLQIAIEAEKVAKENHERFLNLYQEGLADSLDVTQSITELVEAQTDIVTTRYGYMKLMTNLHLAMGTIPTEGSVYSTLDWLTLTP